MGHESDVEEIWRLMERIGVCMFATLEGGRIRARPMGAHVKPSERAIHFLTDVRGGKDGEIAEHPQVCLTFSEGDDYVSVSGRAIVSTDRAKIAELWDMTAEAFWDGVHDPNIRLVTVTPETGEFWEGPGRIVSAVVMATAASMGVTPDLAEHHAKVDL